MYQPSVKKNYFYRFFYEILVLAVPFITAPYVSRVLGADGVGIYSYSSSVMTYFTMFAALGTASYGSREIARHRDDKRAYSKLFFEIELLSVITSTVCIVAWIFVIIFSKNYRYYFMALLPLLFGTMLNISWFFTGLERISYIVIRNTVCKLIGILLLFLLVKEKSDLLLYMIIQSLITMLGNLSMWTHLPKFAVLVPLKELRIKRHFRETLVYFIPTIATSIYTVLDKTLIGVITQDSYQNGYYEQATKIIKILKTAVFVSVNSVMGARISYLFAQKKDTEIRRRIYRSMDFIFLLGMGCVLGLCGVASQFVPIFFGDGYEPVIELLYFMAPLILIVGISNCLGSNYYTPSGRRRDSTKYILIGSITNLGLNLCFIPLWGTKGAVVATLFAESIISLLYVIKSRGYMTFSVLIGLTWKRLIAGVFMLICLLRIRCFLDEFGVIGLVLEICVGGAIYFLVLLLLKDTMLLELIQMARNFVKKRRHKA